MFKHFFKSKRLSPCDCGCRPKIKYGYHKECLNFGQLVWIQCPVCGTVSRQYVNHDDSDIQEAITGWNQGERFQYEKRITDNWIEKED